MCGVGVCGGDAEVCGKSLPPFSFGGGNDRLNA
jgi:hypothetical protein